MPICPLLAKCTRKVSFNHYREVCSNVPADKYKECNYFLEFTSEDKLPKEWSSLLSPISTPSKQTEFKLLPDRRLPTKR